jgi:hypothetical protein
MTTTGEAHISAPRKLMEFDLEQGISILERTPRVLDQMLSSRLRVSTPSSALIAQR